VPRHVDLSLSGHEKRRQQLRQVTRKNSLH
jgi:hypothetical protein